MQSYDNKEIEKKWSKYWEENNIHRTEETNLPKVYVLDMFPFPSGDGLHVGHTRGYTATDVYSRYKRRKGYKVLHPMGWDAFGLPAEKYAMKTGVHPKESTKKAIRRYKEQMNMLGLNYDWGREINTTDENYYKWTQWTFLQMYKKGLIYPSNEPINWCEECKTSLAQEDLEDGLCERCKNPVVKKKLRQWVIKITDYADRLLKDLELLKDWPEYIKDLQREWIGKGEGYSFSFEVEGSDVEIPVFTTRLDTLFGVTFVALAPEGSVTEKLLGNVKNKEEVKKYIKQVETLTDMQRLEEGRQKDGICLEGVYAIHPVTKEKVPIYLAGYVLSSYGTGSVMCVPAHDERDYKFAKEHNIEIKQVIQSKEGESNLPFVENGVLINSGDFSGLDTEEAKIKLSKTVSGAKKETFYKLNDWVFARQRYWGEPIPLINCPDGKTQTVSEKNLPLILPDISEYKPSGTGESPLANVKEWVELSCNGKMCKRETNTMPNWAGSCWYYLRFIDPDNSGALVDKKKERAWMPVDLYVGGVEHATRHLLYARFWHKFLFDIGVVNEEEPFKKLVPVGIIFKDGAKMSKSRGNVVDPVEVMEKVGADAYRLYICFIGPFEKATEWDNNGIVGTRRFLEKVYSLKDKISDKEISSDLKTLVNQTVKKVSEDIEKLHLNTSVSQLMILVNKMIEEKTIDSDTYKTLLKLLAPFCPFITEELWEASGEKGSIHLSDWPEYNESELSSEYVNVAIQVNGKLKGVVKVPFGASEKEVITLAKENIKSIEDLYSKGDPSKTIFVENKILNIL